MTAGFLLDTAAVSEWVKPRPDPGVVRWFDQVDEDQTFLSVLTLGELRRGVEQLPPGSRRDQLANWLAGPLPDRFEGRVLPVGSEVADAWGRLTARLRRAGRPVGSVDSLIAATAECHRLRVVTRDTSGFEPTGVAVLSPWSG